MRCSLEDNLLSTPLTIFSSQPSQLSTKKKQFAADKEEFSLSQTPQELVCITSCFNNITCYSHMKFFNKLPKYPCAFSRQNKYIPHTHSSQDQLQFIQSLRYSSIFIKRTTNCRRTYIFRSHCKYQPRPPDPTLYIVHLQTGWHTIK